MSYEGMITRFRGMNKAEMIEKFNSKNCAPMWDDVQRADAKLAMKNLLNGNVPNVIVEDPNSLAEIEALPDNPPVTVQYEPTEEELLTKDIALAMPKVKVAEVELPEEKFTMKRKPRAKK